MAKPTSKRKDPAAVALGRKGGKARMRDLSPAERAEVARTISLIRWAKYRARQMPPKRLA